VKKSLLLQGEGGSRTAFFFSRPPQYGFSLHLPHVSRLHHCKIFRRFLPQKASCEVPLSLKKNLFVPGWDMI
jgi:hypothetical protein